MKRSPARFRRLAGTSGQSTPAARAETRCYINYRLLVLQVSQVAAAWVGASCGHLICLSARPSVLSFVRSFVPPPNLPLSSEERNEIVNLVYHRRFSNQAESKTQNLQFECGLIGFSIGEQLCGRFTKNRAVPVASITPLSPVAFR